jgi:Phage integrase, N-terminal SAM-like domain
MAWVEQRGSRYRVRMRMPDGSVGTDSCHPTRATAELRRKQVDIDQALDTYLDPARGRITLAEWVTTWEPGHLAGEAKWAAYRSHLRNHILPRFGDVPLTKISRQSVKVFVKQLKTHLAESSTASVMSLLSLLLREAVADRRIPINPCHGVKVITQRPAERPTATPSQVNQITARIDRRNDRILVLTAAYTGMRWGRTGRTRPGQHPPRRGHHPGAPRGRRPARGRWTPLPRPAQDPRLRPHHPPPTIPDHPAAGGPGQP